MRHFGHIPSALVAGVLILSLYGAARSGAPEDAPVNAPINSVATEVKAATEAFYAALNRADPTAADRFLLPGGDSFPRSGGKLDPEAATAEESLQNLRALFAGGLRFHVVIRELQVKPYGDTAVATFYTEGTTEPAAGRPVSRGVFRASYVWVRRSRGWQIAHFHLSPLLQQ